MRLNIPQDLNTHFQSFKSRIKHIFIITKSVSKYCIAIFIFCIVKIKTVEALSYSRNVSGSIPDCMNKNLIVCFRITTLTEVFPCFLLSCKANARVKPSKTGHGPHSSQLLCCYTYFLCCSTYCSFCDVPCIVCVCMCTEQTPPRGYPIVIKYIISYMLFGFIFINCLVF
jgi:hypothetical protein